MTRGPHALARAVRLLAALGLFGASCSEPARSSSPASTSTGGGAGTGGATSATDTASSGEPGTTGSSGGGGNTSGSGGSGAPGGDGGTMAAGAAGEGGESSEVSCGPAYFWDAEETDIPTGITVCSPQPYSGHRAAAVACAFPDDAECQTDADCDADEACLCRFRFAAETACRPADCRTDADCGAGYHCGVAGLNATPEPFGGPHNVLELHCHSAADECQTPADCDQTEYTMSCDWDRSEVRWRCLGLI